MNKKANMRYAETQRRIDGVFLELIKIKEMKEITVSEICRMAQIHRTTFYGHYTDVYDLMQKLLGRVYEKIMEGFLKDEELSLEKGFLETFQLVKENKAFFKYYLENNQMAGLDLIHIPHLLEKKAAELADKMGYSSVDELYYHQAFFNGGLQALLRRWILQDCRETPREMCRLLSQEYHPPLKWRVYLE